MNEEPEPRARRRTVRRVVDWHQAAELLAQGMTIAAVAERVGCSRAALARRRRDDAVFQTWMTRCRAAAADRTTIASPTCAPRCRERSKRRSAPATFA